MSEQTKNQTTVKPEVDAKAKAKKEAKTAKKEARKKAYDVIKELVDKQADPKFKEALTTIRPSLYGVQIVREGGRATKVIEMITEKGQVDEGLLFKEFKVGRVECAGFIRKALKKADKKDRVWINFDEKTGIYKVVGKGEKPPKQYVGYIPIDEEIKLK